MRIEYSMIRVGTPTGAHMASPGLIKHGSTLALDGSGVFPLGVGVSFLIGVGVGLFGFGSGPEHPYSSSHSLFPEGSLKLIGLFST